MPKNGVWNEFMRGAILTREIINDEIEMYIRFAR